MRIIKYNPLIQKWDLYIKIPDNECIYLGSYSELQQARTSYLFRISKMPDFRAEYCTMRRKYQDELHFIQELENQVKELKDHISSSTQLHSLAKRMNDMMHKFYP